MRVRVTGREPVWGQQGPARASVVQKVDDALPGAARTVPTAWHPGNPWHELGPPVTQTSSRPLGH